MSDFEDRQRFNRSDRAADTHTADDAFADAHDIDKLALLRDDVLLDALAKGVFPAEYKDDPLVSALWVWREDVVHGSVEAGPAGVHSELDVPVDAAVPADRSAARPSRRDGSWLRMPRLAMGRRLAIGFAAAAIGALSLGSVAAASSAQPDDVLWPLAKVLNAPRAQSLEAREEALDNLEQARSAVQDNNSDIARERLQEALSDAEKVRNKDGKAELAQELAKLESQLAETEGPKQPKPPQRDNSGSPPPPSPSPSEPSSQPPSPSVSPSPSDPPSASPSQSPVAAEDSTSPSVTASS